MAMDLQELAARRLSRLSDGNEDLWQDRLGTLSCQVLAFRIAVIRLTLNVYRGLRLDRHFPIRRSLLEEEERGR